MRSATTSSALPRRVLATAAGGSVTETGTATAEPGNTKGNLKYYYSKYQVLFSQKLINQGLSVSVFTEFTFNFLIFYRQVNLETNRLPALLTYHRAALISITFIAIWISHA